jgi:hypothetical protein
MNAFLSNWQRFYPASIPVNHSLKISESNRWVRFHSLPESQRYATNDEEMNVILHRQNVLAGSVLGEGAACWMIDRAYFAPGGDPIDPNYAYFADGTPMTWVQAIPDDEDDENDNLSHNIYVAEVIWRAGAFDTLLRDIANWKAVNMWMSRKTGAIFAPYDGGVDIILPTLVEVRALIMEHFDWLSANESGY